MQDRQEPGGAAVSDLAGEPGEASLHQAAPGQSDDCLEPRRICCDWPRPLPDDKASSSRPKEGLPACPAGCPHPGELSAGWGEFEGFRESAASSEQFSQSLEVLERPAEPRSSRAPSVPEERGSCQPHPGGARETGATANAAWEPSVSYESAFRSAFQEASFEQAAEDVSPLDHFLETSSEENPSPASVHRLCSESRKLWRALRSTHAASTSPCLWSRSHCRENLLLVLGIDAAQQSLSGDQSHVPEGSKLREPEELLAVSSFRLHHCQALIQTQLSGTPRSGQGSLITYSLFLKTPPPLHGNRHYITVPRKKLFPPRNLKLAFFKNDVC